MQKTGPLIRTKLRLPFIRPSLVSRPHLQARLAEGLSGPLTLVVAPAGFGKTTLAASSLADFRMPVAWLSLDQTDNQPDRFLTYLIAALQTVDNRIGIDATDLMSSMQQAPLDAALISLINDLDSMSTELALVLDDYHLITNPIVHNKLVFFLEHSPLRIHIVIATRSDPPLPLSRLRARGQVVEVRAADLRFTTEEAAQFLNEVMGLHLDAKSISVLEERTEGWIAGLQMAALSMRDREDVHGFIQGFSGTNRHVLDYLMEEILSGQPSEIQHFLLSTSILERLTASLCDAVLESDGIFVDAAEDRPAQQEPLKSRSASILEYLEQVNLFLIPLDDERTWYRYHHLFTDLLKSQLMHLHPQVVPGLHSRASIWYEQNGWLDQSIEHAFSAGDLDRVSRLVESGAQKLIRQISFETMQNWINRLPEEMVLQKAWIGTTQGWLWVAKMQTGGLSSWLDRVEAHFLTTGRYQYPESEQQDILSNFISLRAYDAFFKGDLQRCADLSSQALKLLSPENADLRVRILVQLGETYMALGDLEQARIYLIDAIEAGIALNEFQSVTTGSMRLYRTLKTLGRLNEAEGMLHKSFQALSNVGRASSPVATKLEQCWADLLRERGLLDEASTQLKMALEHARLYNSPLDIVTTLIYRGFWLTNQADWEAAQKALDEAESVIRSFTIPPVVIASWSLQKARVYLGKGEYERAEQYIHDPAREESRIFQCRLWLKKGEFEKARSQLSQLEQEAVSGHRDGNLIQILLLQAKVLYALGKQPAALDVLVRCLTIAHPQAYLMTFLDEGEPIDNLLKALQNRSLPQPLDDYVIRLLEAFTQRNKRILHQFDSEPQSVPAVQENASPTGDLIEPLSHRELEVLHLIALGKTNHEIAGQLYVSVGTVKAHSASIYRKLDVANRTEAVARARQLGILP